MEKRNRFQVKVGCDFSRTKEKEKTTESDQGPYLRWGTRLVNPHSYPS